MGRVEISRLGGLGFHANTLDEYDSEVSEGVLENNLARIASIYKNAENCVCYVVGMGAQIKSTYVELSSEEGVEVVWSRSILAGFMKLFGSVVASYSGLVRIIDPEQLLPVVKKLSHLSMAGVYIFDKSIEKNFVSCVSVNILPKEFDFGIKRDPRYFFYIVDADNSESSTGIVEVVSCGKASDFAKFLV